MSGKELFLLLMESIREDPVWGLGATNCLRHKGRGGAGAADYLEP